jgi:HD-GYP domain-containing protein (c-di-GMP phosphodiesterase class II)
MCSCIDFAPSGAVSALRSVESFGDGAQSAPADGDGYPDQLAGERIPLIARIVCVCDAYSAMTTDRPYRSALTDADARAEVARCAGTQFDPHVAGALLSVVG